MEFSRQEDWSGLLFASLRALPHSGMELRSYALQADSLPAEPQGSPLWWKSPGGHRKPNTAPEAYARVGKLSFVGCRRGRGKSHHGSPAPTPPPTPLPPGVFGCPWIYFRSGPQYWSPGSWYLWGLWHLWSVEGTEVAPFPWGQGSYPRKKCQLQRLQEKPVLLSL